MRTYADYCFTKLLADLLAAPSVETRNSKCRKLFAPPSFEFDSLPLITVRPVAAMKSLREMEWFMSGDQWCQIELKDWWDGQLGPGDGYWNGYPHQLRKSTWNDSGGISAFDQIEHIIKSIQNHPNSRRHIMTVWNPGEMANITDENHNNGTPTTCHLSFVQFNVTPQRPSKESPYNGTLDMLSIQRSADVLLGLPHNWVQHWSLLVWLAHHCNLKVGRMIWQGGDVHLYDEPSHIQCAKEITDSEWFAWLFNGLATPLYGNARLSYTPSTSTSSTRDIADGYRASDFSIVWPEGTKKPEPLSVIRPVLK